MKEQIYSGYRDIENYLPQSDSQKHSRTMKSETMES